jgi:predicted Fe-Mo cluster-binding NifX family protein
MKVAVSASGGTLDSPVDPRFGRSPYYVLVDTETMEYEALPNTSMNAPSGAGIGAAQVVARRGVDAVLTGSVGPNATQVLSQSGIEILTGAQGTVRQVVDAFKKGELKASTQAGYVGYGRGGGRGMGRGMGRMTGTYQYQPPIAYPEPVTEENEKEMLKKRLEQLEEQLKATKKRLEELKERPSLE